MFMIIVGALVSMLVFFFQRWWTANHPLTPTPEAKAAFLAEVDHPRHFWMGEKRRQMAEKLFDKFAAKASRELPSRSEELTEEDAGVLAANIAEGVTLDPAEVS